MEQNKNSTKGSTNANVSGQKNNPDTRDGKAKGTPSNVNSLNKEETEAALKKNKEGNPDESRIQGDREESNTSRRSGNSERSTQEGGGI